MLLSTEVLADVRDTESPKYKLLLFMWPAEKSSLCV